LKACNGLWVCAENSGGSYLIANRGAVGSWEAFAFMDLTHTKLESGDKLNLRVSNGMYVCAEGGGGGQVNANRTSASTWETFYIRKVNGTGLINSGDQVFLTTLDKGNYVCAENNGGSALVANRTAGGPWETFTFYAN
jgi:hypothetical protein